MYEILNHLNWPCSRRNPVVSHFSVENRFKEIILLTHSTIDSSSKAMSDPVDVDPEMAAAAAAYLPGSPTTKTRVKRRKTTTILEEDDENKSKKKKDDTHTSAKNGEIVDATLEPAQFQDVKHWFLYLLKLFLQLIGVSHQRTIEEDVLPDLIHHKLESAMGEIMAEKMGEKFLDAESKVCSAANQARYFFDKLKEVRKGEEKNA
jgi:hypothetical protein